MTRKKSLSTIDVMQELHSGTVTTKFILKRFSPWLPFDRIDGHHYYSRNTIPILIKIKESLDAGMLPSEIDEELKNPEQTNSTTPIDRYFMDQPNTDIQVSKEGLHLIKSLFNDFEIQQKRVATAQEKRAEAEERKALAMEKRTEAEDKKARAMDNIATALQEMNRNPLQDSQTRDMALLTSQALAENETTPEIPLPDGTKETSLENEAKLDNLYSLIDQSQPLQAATQGKMADAIEVDDLSRLLEDPKSQPDGLDDLSTLIETVSNRTSPETGRQMDDLSVLIDDIAPTEMPQELDNLWLLIESPIPEPQAPMETDDLSLLIEPDALAPMDDLSALIRETPSLKPDITPEENLKEYKTAIMKTILRLKTEGLSAEESTNRLNQDGVQTITGKSKWSEKAISQIYKFINSAN